MVKRYYSYRVEKAVRVTGLVTIEMIGISPAFSYPAETHDFHEFVYVDSGAILCTMGEETVRLGKGEFLLIGPGRTHFYHACEDCPADIFIVCFRCRSELLAVLDRKIALGKPEKRLVGEILREAKNAFTFPFEKKLCTRSDPVFGAQQLVENDIEQLLISLVRNEMRVKEDVKLVMSSVELENHLVNDLAVFLRENLKKHISLDDICREMHYSKTYLNGIFKKYTGYTIMRYYNRLRIMEAEKMLRESSTPGETADELGFESVSYFIKVFRNQTGMTPAAYRRSVQ